MKKYPKLALLLSLLLVISLATAVMAADTSVGKKADISGAPEQQKKYINFAGVIEDLNANGKIISILVKNDTNSILFHVSDEAVLLDEQGKKTETAALKKGQKIVLAYNANAPMTASLPPQITPAIAVLLPDHGFAKVDVFDATGLSADGELKLNMSEETPIFTLSGEKATVADTVDKTLLVYYIIATMSIPPQTPPTLVIILPDGMPASSDSGAVESPDSFDAIPPKEDGLISADDNNTASNVQEESKESVQAPDDIILGSFYNKDGIAMMPIRKIGESYGYDMEWNAITKTVILQKGALSYTITVGELMYGYNRSVRFLSTAPEIVQDRCYVPSEFLDMMEK